MDETDLIAHALYAKHSDIGQFSGDPTFIICTAINETLHEQVAVAAQRLRGLWLLYVKTDEARSSLLRHGHILINNRQITVYNYNPYEKRRVQTERVIIRDLPLYETNDIIFEYLSTQKQIEHSGHIYWCRARNSSNQETDFTNGDRFVEVKADFNPPLPKEVKLGDHPCRIYHATQKLECFRCHKTDHTTGMIDKCDAYLPPEKQNSITPFKSPKNALTNFWEVDVHMDGQTFKSAEHAYLWYFCIELNEPGVAERVFNASTATQAKTISRELHDGRDFSSWSAKKLSIMKNVLCAKAKSSNNFCKILLNTGDKYLVEATRDTFYGAGLTPHLCRTTNPKMHPGQNHLGKLLMELRATLRLKPAHDPTHQHVPVLHSQSTQLDPLPSSSATPPPTSVNSSTATKSSKPLPSSPSVIPATENISVDKPRDNLNRRNQSDHPTNILDSDHKSTSRKSRPISKISSHERSTSLPLVPGLTEISRNTQLITNFLSNSSAKVSTKRKHVTSPSSEHHNTKRVDVDGPNDGYDDTNSVTSAFESCAGDYTVTHELSDSSSVSVLNKTAK